MIELDDAKSMFRDDVDSYGKPKKIMGKLTEIYDSRGTCGECEQYCDDKILREEYCKLHSRPFINHYHLVRKTGYCDDFERKEES